LSVLKANCPSCAAPIEFQKGSTIVLVCPFCRSAVARTDRGLEDLGKIADIVDSESPLKIGLKGTFKEHRFELTGRAQIRHELGGFWDEWYATFSNGWVGWLAEAQGKFYLTFYQPVQKGFTLPPFEQLQLGQTLHEIPSQTPLIVTEKGTATSIAAEGEIPYRLEPNERSDYADLSGAGNAFGTIDYSMNPPWAFVGQQVSLADIGLADAKPVKREAQRVSAAGMGCPNCGGALSLTAPDKSERVTCPYCNSLLDVNQGKLSWLKSLAPKPDAPDFALPIGAEGTFKDGVKFKIIGAVVRSVTVEAIQYFWHEYLLYNPMIGFRWLIHSDNHWNFVEPINSAEVVSFGNTATYNGQTYKIFQDAIATVEYVKGEFYWRVAQGEQVRSADYVNAPLMISQEVTNNEMNWSAGVYMTNADIEQAFNVTDLPKPWSVAPNQPFAGSFYYTWGLLPLALLFLVAIIMIPLSGFGSVPLNQQITLPPMVNATTAQAVFSQSFEIKERRNIKITASAPVSNSWADLDVDLVNEQNDEVESVNVPIEYYSGSDSDGAWTEGSQNQDATLSSLPAGKYTLRVEGTWQNWQQPIPVNVKVEQNVSRGVNFCCAFVILLIVPLFGLIRKFTFESRRWSESMFGSSSSSSSDDSDSE
jgi:Zn finger protein HypA/HybF involved in hydrogenase expression